MVDPQDPAVDLNDLQEACPGEGTLINSGEFDGLNNKEAMKKIIDLYGRKRNRKRYGQLHVSETG